MENNVLPKNNKAKLKKIFCIMRHGSRTSSWIGRREDILLSEKRQGLSLFGKYSLFSVGLNKMNNIKYSNEDNNIKIVNVKGYKRERSISSSIYLFSGLVKSYDEEFIKKYINTKFEDFNKKSFIQNLNCVNKFDSINTYDILLNRILPCLNNVYLHLLKSNENPMYVINDCKFNLDTNFHYGDKEIPQNYKEILKSHLNTFYLKYSQKFLKSFTSIFKRLFLNDISLGVYDFVLEKEINSEYFISLNDDTLDFRQVKHMIDFIYCNQFFEDFTHISQESFYLMKHYTVNFIYEGITKDDHINLIKIKAFLNYLIEEIDSDEKTETSLNIYINHQNLMCTLIKFLFNDKIYKSIIEDEQISDRDFFLIKPSFLGTISLYLFENNKFLLEINEEDVTSLCKSEFLDNHEGSVFIDYNKFKLFFYEELIKLNLT